MGRPIDVDAAINFIGSMNMCDEISDEAYKKLTSYLDELPSAQPELCGDVVSRNAIVQKLNKMDRYVSAELRLCDTDKKFPQNEVFIVDDVYEGIVEQLPSAQPERKKGTWTKDASCPFCGFQPWYERDIHTLSFCPNCGSDMRGEAE